MSKEILKLKKILFLKEKLYDSLQSAKVLRFQWINLKPWYVLFIFKCQVLGYTENYILYLASLVAQTVKNLPAMQETHVWSLDQEDPLEKGWQPTSVFLSGESHEQRSLSGYSPWCRRVRHDWATNIHTHIHIQIFKNLWDKKKCWVSTLKCLVDIDFHKKNGPHFEDRLPTDQQCSVQDCAISQWFNLHDCATHVKWWKQQNVESRAWVPDSWH